MHFHRRVLTLLLRLGPQDPYSHSSIFVSKSSNCDSEYIDKYHRMKRLILFFKFIDNTLEAFELGIQFLYTELIFLKMPFSCFILFCNTGIIALKYTELAFG